jgi:hypothetical protein
LGLGGRRVNPEDVVKLRIFNHCGLSLADSKRE